MPNVLQRTNPERSNEVTPFVQVPNTKTNTKTKYLTHLSAYLAFSFFFSTSKTFSSISPK